MTSAADRRGTALVLVIAATALVGSLGLVALHTERAFPEGDGPFSRRRFGLAFFWSGQGLLAAGRTPPHEAFRYLGSLRRPDGSYRYSVRYVTTPVWVTSQVLAALARKTFPLP